MITSPISESSSCKAWVIEHVQTLFTAFLAYWATAVSKPAKSGLLSFEECKMSGTESDQYTEYKCG